MPVTIHLVRHAQGMHNLSRENEKIQDPKLTKLGEEQCEALRKGFPYHDRLTRLFSSPLKRAVYTCALSFSTTIAGNTSRQKPSIIALPEFQEVSDSPCDTGSDPRLLREEFKNLLDLQRVHDGWNAVPAWVSWDAKVRDLEARAVRARAELKEITQDMGEETHIAIVTHGAFVHFLTSDYYGIKPGHATGWQNTEFRSYHLSESNSTLVLVETEESWERRHGRTSRPSETEQCLLREKYLKQLEQFATPGTGE